MSERVVDVQFFVDGKLFASRIWAFIPRVGDEVMLGAEGAKTAYSVLRVVWGVAGPSTPHKWQSVNIELLPAPPQEDET